MQYRRRDSLVSIYELSKRFIDQLIREMEQDGRYPEDAIIRGKGYILIDEDAFRDFLRHRGTKVPYDLSERSRDKMKKEIWEGIRYWVLGTVGFWAVMFLASIGGGI